MSIFLLVIKLIAPTKLRQEKRTIITDINDIDEAVNTYLKGELPNQMEKLR